MYKQYKDEKTIYEIQIRFENGRFGFDNGKINLKKFNKIREFDNFVTQSFKFSPTTI